jgi:pimeloyl-ACP methyl ester carboxylesterase
MKRRSFLRALAATSLGGLLQGSFGRSAQAQKSTHGAADWAGQGSVISGFPRNSAIILVHAAWADGSCWSNVILPLERHGLQVICAPIPMTSLTNDATALSWALERTSGPVVLVGHAYSGAVIAAVRDDRVKSLVYISAFAPDEGESVAKVFYLNPNSSEAPKIVPDSHGFVWLPADAFHRALAQKASPEQARIAAAVQRPIGVQCIQEPATAPTWTQRFMADRMGAKIRSHPVDHTAMYADPQVVVEVILEAARATLSR